MHFSTITYILVCIDHIQAFVPWRPNILELDSSTLYSIDPSSSAVRRHELRIARAAAKFDRRGGLSNQGREHATPSTLRLNRRADKTSGPIDLESDPNDISYWINVNFGSSNKPFRMVVDTGSADTWIPSKECVSKSCLVHRTFGSEDSATLENVGGKTFSIEYASGNVEGTIGRDSLSFGSVNINMEFGLAKMVSDDFINFPVDGILGLGFSSASVLKVPPLLEILESQNIIEQKFFSTYLHRTADGLGTGSIVFGGFDESRIDGGVEALKYYDVDVASGLWSINMNDVILDGKSVNFDGDRNVVIDTGTALILIPPADALKLHQFIPGTRSNGETFYIPCNTKISIQFQFGKEKYDISRMDYIGDPVDAKGDLCLSLIVGRSVVRDGAWLIGDVFLRNVYSVFDMENARIGFGYLPDTKSSPTSMTSPTKSSATRTNSATSEPPTSSRESSYSTSLFISASTQSPSSTSQLDGLFNPTITNLPEMTNATSSPISPITTTKSKASTSHRIHVFQLWLPFCISILYGISA